MIRKSLLSLIYDGAIIQRWNDHIRPSMGFSELDKQAHKMFFAYCIAKCEKDIDMFKIVEGGIFEYLHRLILTDIRPPIFHELMKAKGQEISRWVIAQLEQHIIAIEKGNFLDRLTRYFFDDTYADKERRVLRYAHYLATRWEFDIVYDANKSFYNIENVKREVDQQLCELSPSFSDTFNKEIKVQEFLNFIGTLRFQNRWAKVARIPQTSVMGHVLVVAIVSYLCSAQIGASDRRRVNNFFSGLFHDLPEVLTRDIVSPVKRSIEGLEDIIKDIENVQMQRVIRPLLPPEWYSEILYYTDDEFVSKVVKNGKLFHVTSDEINKSYNLDRFNPVDGEIVRCCDHLSAFIEVYMSVQNGVNPRSLVDSSRKLLQQYQNKVVGGISFSDLFEYFEI